MKHYCDYSLVFHFYLAGIFSKDRTVSFKTLKIFLNQLTFLLIDVLKSSNLKLIKFFDCTVKLYVFLTIIVINTIELISWKCLKENYTFEKKSLK